MTRKLRNPKKENKRLYGIYHGMKRRCYNENEKRYNDYGGRGIVMCDEWLDLNTGFDSFCDLAKSNGYNDELSIERKDVNGNYCPDNCEWITMFRQARNKRTTVFVEYKGQKKCLKDWCEELNLSYDAINNRISKGWPPTMAFEKPLASEHKSFAQICREHNINQGTARDRIVKFGWNYNDALETPTFGRGSNSKTYNPEQFGYSYCKVCGHKFLKNNSKQIYCGEKCRSISKRTSFRMTGKVIDMRKNVGLAGGGV